ncbi:MAG: DUF2059 domain-containing protein [Pseudomonadota bacterium]
MRVLIGCIAILFSTIVNAQTISDDMKDDIHKLLDVTGALKIGEQMGSMISQQIIAAMNMQARNVPPEATAVVIEVVRGHISDFIQSDASVAGLTDIYAKHYSHEEIKDLIDFYNSPIGLKMMQEGPQIALESAQFGQTLFMQRVPQIQKDIQEKLQAAGLQPQPAPQPEAEAQ